MKVKTAELSGKSLNWAVETLEFARIEAEGEYIKAWWREARQAHPSPYSTDWLLAGPIIERERICTEWSPLWGCWTARDLRNAAISFTGPTPLIAAMRCFVASRLGDEVDIPDELTNPGGPEYEPANRR